MKYELVPPKFISSRERLIFLVVILAMLITACSSDDTGSQPAPDDSLAAEGQTVFEKNCARCHSFVEGKVIVGPSLYGVASRASTRIEGLDASEYFHLAITKPSAYLVDGFNDLMPSNFRQLLSAEEIEAVIAYLLIFE